MSDKVKQQSPLVTNGEADEKPGEPAANNGEADEKPAANKGEADEKPAANKGEADEKPGEPAANNGEAQAKVGSLSKSVAEVMFEAQPTYYKRSDFDKNFMFGSATSAFQIEGGRNRDRQDSIWDVFAEKRGFFGKYKEDAVNHREHYKVDVGIMEKIGFNAYRFSISWSRICPSGKKNLISRDGINFYRDLLKELKAKGITPFVTLFHWDTPLALQTEEYPGFLDPRIADDFADYAQICFEEFGDLVGNWITLNEPYTYAYMAHVTNDHAPGFGTVKENLFNTGTNKENGGSRLTGHRSKTDKTEEKKSVFKLPIGTDSGYKNISLQDTKAYPYIVTHNMLRAHGKAYQKFQEYKENPNFASTRLANQQIGITLVSMWFEPYNSYDDLDRDAKMRALDFFLGWYLNPLVHGEYPTSMRKNVDKTHLPQMTDEDRKLIQGSYDFIGVNYYTARYVRHKVSKPKHLTDGRNYITDQHLKYYEKCKTKWGNMRSIGVDRGASAWLISHPPGMQKLLCHIKTNYKNPIIYVTENGIDDPDDDCKKNWASLFDHKRMTYIRDHLYYIWKAIKEDEVNVKGYFVWSLLDNFEWNNNFDVRFGITYVDFRDASRKRHLKLSATWLQYFLAGKGNQTVTGDKLDDDIASEDETDDDEGN